MEAKSRSQRFQGVAAKEMVLALLRRIEDKLIELGFEKQEVTETIFVNFDKKIMVITSFDSNIRFVEISYQILYSSNSLEDLDPDKVASLLSEEIDRAQEYFE